MNLTLLNLRLLRLVSVSCLAEFTKTKRGSDLNGTTIIPVSVRHRITLNARALGKALLPYV